MSLHRCTPESLSALASHLRVQNLRLAELIDRHPDVKDKISADIKARQEVIKQIEDVLEDV